MSIITIDILIWLPIVAYSAYRLWRFFYPKKDKNSFYVKFDNHPFEEKEVLTMGDGQKVVVLKSKGNLVLVKPI